MTLLSLDELERTLNERAARRPKRAKPAAPAAVSTLPSPDAQRMRAFEYYEFNVGLPVVEQTHRARALREIARIATWYGWGAEVTRALDAEGVAAAGELSDDGIEKLVTRMKALEDCAQSGCDPDDMPSAR